MPALPIIKRDVSDIAHEVSAQSSSLALGLMIQITPL